MLDHLRQKAAQTLASASTVILSSYGPADIQSNRVASVSRDLTLYVFIPYSSNHLLNLEHRPSVVVLGEDWELHGTAQIQCAAEVPAGLPLLALPQATWGRLVAVHPYRLHLHRGTPETIDLMDASENQ